jgi:outer membrane protein assembly factor BamA
LGGDVSFERVRLIGSTILPLGNSTHAVLRVESTWLSPKDGSDAIPIQERLFNGGKITVRSFREDRLAPADLKDVSGRVIGPLRFDDALNPDREPGDRKWRFHFSIGYPF